MLYIMRHGKTAWNELHKLQGRTDIPLNEAGRRMAKEARNKYQDVHFDVCYCSPLQRAVETAELVLEGRNVPILIDERLQEMSFGSYEGTANCYQIPNCPVSVLFTNPERYCSVENGESLEELFNRTGAFIREIVMPALSSEKDLLIVGHGAMNASIICQIKGLPIEKLWSTGIENCKLIQLK